jgi:hypothetical protein
MEFQVRVGYGGLKDINQIYHYAQFKALRLGMQDDYALVTIYDNL